METINEAVFFLLNASDQPNPILLVVAKLFADYAIWLVPLALMMGWLRGSESTRKLMLAATASGFAGLLFNLAIGLLWQHPRPFMIGLGHTLIAHAPDSSFPSDHLTLLWAVSFGFLMHQRTRTAGAVLTLLALPIAWARIYLGVHFPMDILGSAIVAGLSAWLCFREQRWYLEPIFRFATAIHLRFCAPLIRRGWVRK